MTVSPHDVFLFVTDTQLRIEVSGDVNESTGSVDCFCDLAKSQKNLACTLILASTRTSVEPYTLITVMIDFADKQD